MPFRPVQLLAAILLLIGAWSLGPLRTADNRAWTAGPGAPPPVRILSFYASVGAVHEGEAALLCYGVENARKVRIAPLPPGVLPAASHCVEVTPEHTTHYTILAEGYSGEVATRSLTLPVEREARPVGNLRVAYSARDLDYDLSLCRPLPAPPTM